MSKIQSYPVARGFCILGAVVFAIILAETGAVGHALGLGAFLFTALGLQALAVCRTRAAAAIYEPPTAASPEAAEVRAKV
ncbi:MAG TPA: hypothetical protein VEA15_09555 [Caulobacteraceae bacterium]|nr:hypothetical protein [Caulobacteraceae bacterium]